MMGIMILLMGNQIYLDEEGLKKLDEAVKEATDNSLKD